MRKQVVQGSFDYASASGLGLNLFVGNSDSVNFDSSPAEVEADQEFDPTISYTFNLTEDIKVWLAATQFLYVKNTSNNTLDLQAALMWKMIRFDISHINNFFGFKSAANHLRIGVRDSLTENTGYFASVGSTSFRKEDLVGYKSYVDYKLGLYQTNGNLTTEIYFTNTDRKNLSNVQQSDAAAIAALNIAFN